MTQSRKKITGKFMRSNTNRNEITPTSPHSRWRLFEMRIITTTSYTTTSWYVRAVHSSPPTRQWLISKFLKCIYTLYLSSNYFARIVTKASFNSGIEFWNKTVDAFLSSLHSPFDSVIFNETIFYYHNITNQKIQLLLMLCPL